MKAVYGPTSHCTGPAPLRSCMSASLTLRRSLPIKSQRSMTNLRHRVHQDRGVAAAVASTDSRSNAVAAKGRAAEVVAEFYKRYNSGDVEGVMELMADRVSYHDLALYQEPFVGRAAVRAYFEKVTSIVPPDLKFTFEASAGDDRAVGIRWHVELEGHEFPFSRGVSFYEVDEQGKITSARDLVESAAKPGSAALYALKVLAPVIRRLGPKANPANLPPTSGLIMWGFYAAYLLHIILGTTAPGRAAWQQTPESLTRVLNESINFFYVNIWLNIVPAVASHPVSEAQFNFVIAWGLMLGVFIFADKKAEKVPNKLAFFLGNAFITNLVFIPWMALRECQREPSQEGPDTRTVLLLPVWAPFTAAICLGVGMLSLGWAVAARPEYGGLAERWQYYLQSVTSDRIFYAFAVDAVLYTVWQAALMPKEAGRLRFVPFFGLGAYLLGTNRSTK